MMVISYHHGHVAFKQALDENGWIGEEWHVIISMQDDVSMALSALRLVWTEMAYLIRRSFHFFWTTLFHSSANQIAHVSESPMQNMHMQYDAMLARLQRRPKELVRIVLPGRRPAGQKKICVFGVTEIGPHRPLHDARWLEVFPHQGPKDRSMYACN
jgi:hypothetical protein